MSAAAPYGRNGSLPDSSLYSRTSKPHSSTSHQQQQWAPSAQQSSASHPQQPQREDPTPTVSTARANYQSAAYVSDVELVSTATNNKSSAAYKSAARQQQQQNMHPELCRCAIKCDECGHNLQLPTGCCLTAEGVPCQDRPAYRLHVPATADGGDASDDRRLVSSLNQEEAEILAELNRNKHISGYVQSTRRFVMIVAAVHWGFLTYLFSKCKNTGSCDDLVHTIQFYNAIPSLISTVFFAAILFGTSIWLTTLLDVTVHIAVGIVRLFRWLTGHDEEEVENPAELIIITTELRDQQQAQSPASRSTTSRDSNRSAREEAAEGSGETGQTPPVSTSQAYEDLQPAPAAETYIGTAAGNEDVEEADNMEASVDQSGSWPVMSWLTGLVAAGQSTGRDSDGSASGSRSSATQQQQLSGSASGTTGGIQVAAPGSKSTSRTSTLQQGRQGSRGPGSSIYTPSGATTDTRIITTSQSSTPTPEVVLTPFSMEAMAAETAARTALIGAQEAEEHQSRSSMELVAELSNTFISTVRRSAEALHQALFWGAGAEQEDGTDGEGTTVLGTEEADVDRDPYYEDQLNEEDVRDADRSGTKHSEATELERQLSSAAALSRRSPDSVTRTPTSVGGAGGSSSARSRRTPQPLVAAEGDITSSGRTAPSSRSRTLPRTGVMGSSSMGAHSSGRAPSHKTATQMSSATRSAVREVQTSDSLFGPAPGKRTGDPSETAHILSSAGLSSYNSGSNARGRMEDQMKIANPSCVKGCNQGAAAPERSADFAMMGSSGQNNAVSESSARNTSALSHGISPCKCDSTKEDRSLMRSTHPTSNPASTSHKSNKVIRSQQPTQQKSQKPTPASASNMQQQMRLYAAKNEGDRVVDASDVSSGRTANQMNPSTRRFMDAPDVISAQKEAVLSELAAANKRRSKSYAGEALRTHQNQKMTLQGGTGQLTSSNRHRRRRRIQRQEEACGGSNQCCNNNNTNNNLFLPLRDSSGGCSNVHEEVSAIAHGRYYYHPSSDDDVISCCCKSDPINAPSAAAAVLKSKFIKKLEKPNHAPIQMIIESYAPSVRLSRRNYSADVDTISASYCGNSGVNMMGVDVVGDTGGVIMSNKRSSYGTSTPAGAFSNSSGAPSTAFVLNQRYNGPCTSGESRSRVSPPTSCQLYSRTAYSD